jgi:SAF domain
VRGRRRPGLWVAGGGLVVLAGLAGPVLVGQAGHRVPVLAVARTVHVGQPVADGDVVVARVAADPALHPVLAADRDRVVGRVAAVQLRPGSLLTASELTGAPVPGPGELLVGVPVKPGQWPARGLTPGDQVLAMPTPTDQATGGGGGPGSGAAGGPVRARVAEVGPADPDGTVTVDLAVDERSAPVVGGWGSTGRVVLLLLPAGG